MIISFDIGGTSIKYGLINSNFDFIEKHMIDTNAHLGGSSIVSKMIQIIVDYQKKYDVEGIAISSAGVIDYQNGIILSSTDSIKDYVGINLKKIIEDTTHLFVTVENDVNCVALAELQYIDKKIKNILFMTIGTGIGGAIVIDNKLYRGHSMSAGEWGNMFINDKSFEEQASISAILENAHKKGLLVNSGVELFNLYDQGDLIAISVIKDFYHYLSIGISNLIYTFNPELIIIGGGISNRGDRMLTELSKNLEICLPKYYLNSFDLKLAKNLNDSGMIGAYLHHINQLQTIVNHKKTPL